MKLEVDKIYTLRYSGEFCSITVQYESDKDFMNTELHEGTLEGKFVGTINIHEGERHIFYNNRHAYIMFDANKVDSYVLDPKEVEYYKLKRKLEELGKELGIQE